MIDLAKASPKICHAMINKFSLIIDNYFLKLTKIQQILFSKAFGKICLKMIKFENYWLPK